MLQAELIGKVNRTWTHDGESPSTEVLAINNWVPTNAFTSYNTTVTENNGGLHIVSASAEDGKSINISLDLIEETDQLCITNLKYKFDTEDANELSASVLRRLQICILAKAPTTQMEIKQMVVLSIL